MPLRHIWLTTLLAFLAACSGPNPPQATLALEPGSLTISAGAVPQTFSAAVTGGSGEVAWTLTGPGSLSATRGSTTDYTPPETVPSVQTATLEATLVGTEASDSAAITINPAQATTGHLRVNVLELPAGVDAEVRVGGPNGFSETLTATRTLIELEPGTYTVSAEDVRELVNGAETLYRGEATCGSGVAALASCSAQVAAGDLAEVAVEYEPVPGTGFLYIPDYTSGSVGAYSASQLATSNAEPPAETLEGTPSAQGVAFDRDGILWVSDWGNQLRKYDLGQPSTDPPTPAVVISSGLVNPTAIAFDKDGSLWVTNRGNATVVKFSAEQLSASGNPTPAVMLSDDGSGNLSGPNGVAFDEEGRLWFSNLFSQSLYRYDDPGSLSGETSASPDVILSATLTEPESLDGPSGLAFDRNGNLWVSNQGSSTLVKFAPEQLETPGTPTPEVTLSGLAGPNGLAFDAEGNLWVSNGGSTVVKLEAADLAASGSPAPAVVLSGLTGIDLGFLAFNPPPRDLPLEQRPAAE